MRCLWLVTILVLCSCNDPVASPVDQKTVNENGLPAGCVFLPVKTERRFSTFSELFFRENVGVIVNNAVVDKGYSCGNRKVFPIRAMTKGYPHERVWFVEIADEEGSAVLIRPE